MFVGALAAAGCASEPTAPIVQYNTITEAFSLQPYAGAYTRAGVTLTLAGYAGTDSATGASQINLLASHAVLDFGADTGPSVTADLYRHVGQ